MKFSRMFMALAASALAAGAAAQVPGPKQSSPWGIDYGVQRCSLYKQVDGTLVMLRIIPGILNPELTLIRDDWGRAASAKKVSVALLPGGPSLESVPVWADAPGGRAVMVDGLGRDYLDSVAASASLSLGLGDSRYEIPLPGAAKAVAALRTCNADLLRGWGIDVEGQAALKQPPTAIHRNGPWFTPEDYPENALKRRESGTVVVRLDIAATGAVEACTVVAGSGSAHLDEATCRVFRERGAYMPAVNADGALVPWRIIATTHWIAP